MVLNLTAISQKSLAVLADLQSSRITEFRLSCAECDISDHGKSSPWIVLYHLMGRPTASIPHVRCALPGVEMLAACLPNNTTTLELGFAKCKEVG